MSSKNVKSKSTAQTVKEEEKKEKIDLSNYPSKSAAIRDLASKNYSRAQIANLLDIRYQHVRNVLVTPLMRDQKKN